MANLNKRQLAALVLEKLDGGVHTTQSKYDERMIFLYLDGAIAEAISASIKETGVIDSGWIKPFYVTELWNDKRKEAYFNLPAPILDLPMEQGLFQISYVQDQSNPYVISRIGSQSYFNGLEASNIQNTFSCYLEGDTVFVKKNKSDMTELLVKLIPSSEGYSDTESLSYPSDKQNYIVDATYKLALSQLAQKMVNNQNPNT